MEHHIFYLELTKRVSLSNVRKGENELHKIQKLLAENIKIDKTWTIFFDEHPKYIVEKN